jgi:acetyl-CoA synthetase
VAAAAARHAFPVCGPNCNGIVNVHARSVLWGDALAPREAGPVALISQSGNVAVNSLASRRGLRFHTVVASGNQAVLSAADYLEYLAGEDGVGAIALYLEDDGGPGLCDGLAACAQRGIPVAVLKVGSSPAGARAAAAHSAALAGDQRVFEALVREAGAIVAEDVHELLELAKTLALPRARPRRPGLAIMTCSGGDSAQAADECHRLGLELPPLAADTCTRLRSLLPPAATVGNPLDYTAMIWGDSELLAELIRTVGGDRAIGQVLVFYDQLPGIEGAAAESWAAVRAGIVAGAASCPVPVLVSSTLPEHLDDGAAWEFARAGVPAVAGLRTGLRCAAAMREPAGDPVRLRDIAQAARARARSEPAGSWLAEHAVKAQLRCAGIPVPEGRLVSDGDDAVRALAELGGAIVLKLSSPAVQHKSELGGVELGLDQESEVRGAFARIQALTGEYGGSVLAERMAASGVELLVAASFDGVVPALVLGLGGIWTELLADVCVVPLPADAARVERGLRSLRGAGLLTGARGRAPLDMGAAACAAARVGELLLSGDFQLIELNPLLVSEEGVVALDGAARLASELAPAAEELEASRA